MATFGRGGGTGGFELNYRVKNKQKRTKTHDRNEHEHLQHTNIRDNIREEYEDWNIWVKAGW